MKKEIHVNIEKRSLSELAANKMEELIRDGIFAPGDRLPNEYDLSEMLHVGRSTVRESIKILESRHVLRIRRGYGTFVCNNVGITEDPLGLRFMGQQKKLSLDLSEARMMIEPGIAKLAAKNASEEDIAELQNTCNEVALLIKQGKNYTQKDMAFHVKIAQSTGNLVVSRVIPIICSGIETYTQATKHSAAGTAAITHQMIVDAICLRDEAGAFFAMERHLRDNRDTLLLLPDDV